MSKHTNHGWLPVDIELDAHPELVSETPVRWLNLGPVPLAEPFFEQTVAKVRDSAPPAHEITTDRDVLLRLASQLPVAPPAGVIFHISHCGSTLLANALKAGKDTTVISESMLMAKLLRRYQPPLSPYLAERWGNIRRSLLDSAFRLYACHRNAWPDSLILKFTSINLHGLAVVRAHWPQTPCLILVRDPAEVIVSSLKDRGWLSLRSQPALARQIFAFDAQDPAPEEMSEEEFCARVAGNLMNAALQQSGEQCRVVDYEDLNARRIRDIARFFEIELPPDRESLDRVFRWYAKDPARATEFRDDRARKKKLTTPAIIEASRQWAMPAYSALRARDAGF